MERAGKPEGKGVASFGHVLNNGLQAADMELVSSEGASLPSLLPMKPVRLKYPHS